MSIRIINITDSDNYVHILRLDEDDELVISLVDSEESDTSIAAVINGSSGVELGTWNRDGEYLQHWHERSDS